MRLAKDPAMQAVVGRRALEKQAASTNTLSCFETEVLVTEYGMSAQLRPRTFGHKEELVFLGKELLETVKADVDPTKGSSAE